MAKSHFLQNSFVSGELSPIVKGRTDLDQYYQCLETAENVVTVPQGGVKRRPGFENITIPIDTGFRRATTPTMPNGGTGTLINDGSTITNTTTTTNVGTISDYIIAQYDLGSQQSVGFIDVLGRCIKPDHISMCDLADLTSSKTLVSPCDSKKFWFHQKDRSEIFF